MADGDYTKRCAKCGQVKPGCEYGKRKASKDGLHVYCKECRKEEQAEYYARNKETVLARHRIWCELHPEKVREYSRKHQEKLRKSDPDGYREYMRKYRPPELNRKYARDDYNRNKQARLDAAKQWRSRNKEACYRLSKAYRENNPERIKALRWAYKARKKGAEGFYTGDDIKRLLKLQRGRCACCGRPLYGKYHVDHIIPLALGGTNWPSNLQLLHARCNMMKGSKHPVDFMQQIGLLI